MKARAEVERDVAVYFARHRIGAVAATEQPWPQRVSLGAPTKSELAANAATYAATIDELARWSENAPVSLEFASRRVGGALHDIPTHVIVGTVDDAAALCGRAAKASLRKSRIRAFRLREFASIGPDTVARVLKATDAWDDVDFELLVAASRWFAENDATGLTPRQVPLPGFSAKWLDDAGKRLLIEDITSVPLVLADRPRTVMFSYLDPSYLESGGRRFDSYTEGDVASLPYAPTVCFIVENKDTCLVFPPVSGGICVFGSGWAGVALLPRLPWLSQMGDFFYWGDIDADGFEILDAYRSTGMHLESLFMDMHTYKRYECFGTDMSTSKLSLGARVEKSLVHLTEAEREVYRLIVSSECKTHRRIEQERISLDELKRVLEALESRFH